MTNTGTLATEFSYRLKNSHLGHHIPLAVWKQPENLGVPTINVKINLILWGFNKFYRVFWVSTAWRILRLWMEEIEYLWMRWISGRRQPIRGGHPAWRLGKGLALLTIKIACYELLHRALELAGFCEHGNEPSDSIQGVISWLSELLLASQEELCSVELFC